MDGLGPDGDYECDMCDTCEAVLHTNCLKQVSNFRGEYSLCSLCLQKFQEAGGIKSVPCDIRSLPNVAWKKLHSMFRGADVGEGNGDVDTKEGAVEDRARIEEVVGLRRTLDCHLEHMVKYLELDQNGLQPEEFRSAVLSTVKATVAWQSQPLSAKELSDKIKDLSGLMQQTLKQYGLIK